MASHPIYRIYSKLEDTDLKIWRRFEVMDNITVARLAYIIMTMYEMQASHLFAFERTDIHDNIHLSKPIVFTYELPSEENDDPYTIDATSVSIRSFFGNSNTRRSFLYDFGEGWEISLVCEEIICDAGLPGKMLPRVIDGEGYGIIEDCGGTTGLEEFAANFSNEAKATIGTDLNPFAFDKEDMNFRLQKVPRIYRDIYEYQLEPTAQSMKILERKYKLK